MNGVLGHFLDTFDITAPATKVGSYGLPKKDEEEICIKCGQDMLTPAMNVV
jgi:hypothetical protein